MARQTPQFFVPKTESKFIDFVQLYNQIIPFLFIIFRFLCFCWLETSLAQFYNNESGMQARDESLKLSREYIRSKAPGKFSWYCVCKQAAKLKQSSTGTYSHQIMPWDAR